MLVNIPDHAKQIETCYIGCGKTSCYQHAHDAYTVLKDGALEPLGVKFIGSRGLSTHTLPKLPPENTATWVAQAALYEPFENLAKVWRSQAVINLTNPKAKKRDRREAKQQIRLSTALEKLIRSVEQRL